VKRVCLGTRKSQLGEHFRRRLKRTLSRLTSAPDATSQILTVLSFDPLTTSVPSGEKPSEFTLPACPVCLHTCRTPRPGTGTKTGYGDPTVGNSVGAYTLPVPEFALPAWPVWLHTCHPRRLAHASPAPSLHLPLSLPHSLCNSLSLSPAPSMSRCLSFALPAHLPTMVPRRARI
jgi:hypothetical protein